MIFGYNGRDGVVTEDNGLIYMRARYYSPEMKRFVNADIVPGQISNAITLNRFAYANGNPVSFVDPFGVSAERSGTIQDTSVYGPHLPTTSTQTYYSASWQSVSGSAGNDVASASGGLYLGSAYAGLMDTGLGAEAGIGALLFGFGLDISFVFD